MKLNLFINTYLVPSKFGQTYDRGILDSYDKVDIFRFMLHSLSSIDFKNISIYCKLDDIYQNRMSDILDTAYQCFNSPNVYFHRNESQIEWQNAITPYVNSEHNTLLFTNHDHIFLSNPDNLYNICKELNDTSSNVQDRQIYPTHWPELTTWAGLHTYKIRQHSTSFLQHSRDGVQVLNPSALYRWFFKNTYTHSFGRTDGLHESNIEPTEILVPNMELFRHFDAYNSVGICPALTIPIGLIDDKEKFIVYGDDTHHDGRVNITPLLPSLDVNKKGAEYRSSYSNIPYFFIHNKYYIDNVNKYNEDIMRAEEKNIIDNIKCYFLNKQLEAGI